MKDKNIVKIVFSLLLIILIAFISLYYLKGKFNNFLNKNGAVKVCKYIVSTKINKSLNADLTESTYSKNKDDITVNLFFKTYNAKLKKYEPTVANCVFDRYIINNEEIKLKKFFYQDVYKNTYMYFNTLIKLVNIKTCDLK